MGISSIEQQEQAQSVPLVEALRSAACGPRPWWGGTAGASGSTGHGRVDADGVGPRLGGTCDFLRVRYAQFHRPMWDELTSGLSERELRGRPHPRANTIVWLVWHIARVEDLGVNRFVVDGRQRMDRGDWATRMRVTRRVSAPA